MYVRCSASSNFNLSILAVLAGKLHNRPINYVINEYAYKCSIKMDFTTLCLIVIITIIIYPTGALVYIYIIPV